jgi:hypothetical protein
MGFIYLDTNMYSHLTRHYELWKPLSEFLKSQRLKLAFSDANLVELADVPDQHNVIIEILLQVPTIIAKSLETIITEEVEAYPQRRTASLALFDISLRNDGRELLQRLFSSPHLRHSRAQQLTDAKQMSVRHAALKSNYPPSGSGKYTQRQSKEFADFQTFQLLAQQHRGFLLEFHAQQKVPATNTFLSLRLFALVNFYSYYLGRRKPKKQSDFGDLFHTFYLPYCDYVVIERDLCNILSQIKRHHDILSSTKITNIDFFEDWN